MKERPILFSGPMVRALLDGRKTQTRRIMRYQPTYNADRQQWEYQSPKCSASWSGHRPLSCGRLIAQDDCQYGVRGDRLWVRETHALVAPSLSGRLEYAGARIAESDYGPVEIWYRADGALGIMSMLFADGPRWRPSIHMPRWASRLTLEVTQVRVERLQDISEEDAIAEGIEPVPGGYRNYMPEREAQGLATSFASPRESFFSLWESIHGTEAWVTNPWVWVVEFQKVGET